MERQVIIQDCTGWIISFTNPQKTTPTGISNPENFLRRHIQALHNFSTRRSKIVTISPWNGHHRSLLSSQCSTIRQTDPKLTRISLGSSFFKTLLGSNIRIIFWRKSKVITWSLISYFVNPISANLEWHWYINSRLKLYTVTTLNKKGKGRRIN